VPLSMRSLPLTRRAKRTGKLPSACRGISASASAVLTKSAADTVTEARFQVLNSFVPPVKREMAVPGDIATLLRRTCVDVPPSTSMS
jgi:hypothetical protein